MYINNEGLWEKRNCIILPLLDAACYMLQKLSHGSSDLMYVPSLRRRQLNHPNKVWYVDAKPSQLDQ